MLDLETRCSAADVGGWGQCHLMGVSLVVLHETHTGVATTYREHDLERLCRRWKKLDLVVGFNIKRFDYRVLQPYTKIRLAEVPTLDILEEVNTVLGHRLSLNHLAEKTLGESKSGDGLLALELVHGKMGRTGFLLPPGRGPHPPPLRIRGAARPPDLPAPPGSPGAVAGGLAGGALFPPVDHPSLQPFSVNFPPPTFIAVAKRASCKIHL